MKRIKKPKTPQKKKIEGLLLDFKTKGLTFLYKRKGSSYCFLFEKGKGYNIYNRQKANTFIANAAKNMSFHVRKRIEKGLYVPINKDKERNRISTVYFNPDKIKKNIGDYCVCIDINACYFNTAKKLGVISEEYYVKDYKIYNSFRDELSLYDEDTKECAEKRKEVLLKMFHYKEARNISIGALGTKTFYNYYKNGIKDVEKSYSFRKDTNVVRLDIIDYVWNMACDVNTRLNGNVLMYLTDGFFVHKSYENKVKAILDEYGYKYKVCEVLFLGIKKHSQSSYSVYWDKRPVDSKKPFNLSIDDASVQSFGKRNITTI